MWGTIGTLVILILACYGVYYLIQDLFRFIKHRPGPPVSMLVVMRNRALDVEYLMGRLDAWRKCQWVELELVVVDDGSEDDTVKILRNLQQKYSFRLVTLEQEALTDNLEGKALYTGLLHCHNALVWLVDLRKLPKGMLAEKVFRVFFCQGWR